MQHTNEAFYLNTKRCYSIALAMTYRDRNPWSGKLGPGTESLLIIHLNVLFPTN